MISHGLRNLVLVFLEEDYDSTVALIKIRVDHFWLKLGSFSNKYVSLLKYEATTKNLIYH